MKQILDALDFIIDALRKGDNDFAVLLCLALKARLISQQENRKLNREIGMKKREMIDSIKKFKL